MKRFPYHDLYDSGVLAQRVKALNERLRVCVVCPRHCEARRFEEEEGFCKSGRAPLVASTTAHFGEEPVLVGPGGSGNVFFGSCNLRCVYCQNWQISHPNPQKRDNEMTCSALASRLIALQERGCSHLNFVSPSHFVPQMVEAIFLAIPSGLKLPIVYNTNAYDDLETLRLLDGIVDIYLPDLKYADDLTALKYSQAKIYTEVSQTAVAEMFRQVGLLQLDEKGLARRGLIVRHLILPNDLAETEETFRFLAEKISPEVSVSVMSQYYPTHKAARVPLLSRRIRESEYSRALELLERYGLCNGWAQDFESADVYRPDFTRDEPFDRSEI